jgi:hypothetical protein
MTIGFKFKMKKRVNSITKPEDFAEHVPQISPCMKIIQNDKQ